jgi:glycosidase
MSAPRYPSLYQVNTRVWLTDLSRALGRAATLDDVPDADLDWFAAQGFDWVWLLSVWQTGPAGRRVSRTNAEWRREFEETLPDLREEDIAGSGFAITGYTVADQLGGSAALARLRERLLSRGLRLMLDFVPNHTGLDHSWVDQHPDYFVHGTEERPRPGAREFHPGRSRRRRPDPRARARPVFPRLAGHTAARLRQPGAAGRDDRRAVLGCRAVRRRALRHGHARAA